MAALSGVVGLVLASTASADCFYYQADSYATPEVVKHLSQGEEDSFRKEFSPEVYAQDGRLPRPYGPDLRLRNYRALNSYFVEYDLWVPATDYYIAEMVSHFPPKILVQSENRVLAEASGEDQGGQYFAELHVSGRQAHRAADGHVKVIFTSANPGSTGPILGRVIHLRYRNDIGDDWPGEKWIPRQAHLERYGQCEPAAVAADPPSDRRRNREGNGSNWGTNTSTGGGYNRRPADPVDSPINFNGLNQQ
ncbi:MAG: hypothetical protein KDH88_17270 [Chromatiales bacterium]|nr:hypothetical protein [Chromatiales bacterium]